MLIVYLRLFSNFKIDFLINENKSITEKQFVTSLQGNLRVLIQIMVSKLNSNYNIN